jgi:hypothetical protein
VVYALPAVSGVQYAPKSRIPTLEAYTVSNWMVMVLNNTSTRLMLGVAGKSDTVVTSKVSTLLELIVNSLLLIAAARIE